MILEPLDQKPPDFVQKKEMAELSEFKMEVVKGEDTKVEAKKEPAEQKVEISEVKVDSGTPLTHEELGVFYKQTIHNMRRHGMEGLEGQLKFEDVQDFVSLNFDCFMGALVKVAQEKVGPAPTEFAVLGLGSLSRYEASPGSDLDFAIVIKEDTEENREYFKDLCTEMFAQVSLLGEKKGITFCDGGLTPPFNQGKSTIDFGSRSLLDTPESLAKWSLPGQSHPDYSRRENLANPGNIQSSLDSVHLMYGDKNLVKEYQEHCRTELSRKPSKQALATDYKEYKKAKEISYRQIKALNFLHAKDVQPSVSGEIDLKYDVMRPIQRTVGGLCMYYGIEEANISRGLDQLHQRGIVSGSLYTSMKKAYALASEKRTRKQLGSFAKDESRGKEKLSHEEMQDIQRTLTVMEQKTSQFVRSNGRKNPFAK